VTGPRTVRPYAAATHFVKLCTDIRSLSAEDKDWIPRIIEMSTVPASPHLFGEAERK
jgi:hypothetical protein